MPESLIPAGYLSLADADDLADALPELASYKAADTDARAAALLQATIDIDVAMPYQGSKYDTAQHRQFPRIFAADGIAGASRVWDWDDDAEEPVIPAAIRRATLYQADAILTSTRELRLSAQHDGVVYQQSEDSAESYKSTPGSGVPTGLCRRAYVVMRRYRLHGGPMR